MKDKITKVGLPVTQDSKNIALLIWVGTIPFGFIPGLIGYLFKNDDAFITEHSKEALNWAITLFIAYTLASFLTIIFIGVLMLPLIGICHLVFCILGAVAASKGELYLAPVAIRLIK
ncbi:MAG: putative Tic20 family protein [Marinomonas primoryensis]